MSKTDAGVKFALAFQEWLEARAESAKEDTGAYGDLPNDEIVAISERNLDRRTAADHRLIRTPTAVGFQIVQKFEALEIMVSEREHDGRPTDNRHLLMLASFKGDLYRFRYELQGDD
jgi:hypothetical protein